MHFTLENLKVLQKAKKAEEQFHKGKKSFFLWYTILFFAVSGIVFIWWISKGRTFVWQNDGWAQHFRALVYYGEYLRDIVKTIVTEHKVVIKAWDFAIGEGSDVLQSLHYYVIGDPFAVFSVFVPTSCMHIYYSAMILLRLYCAGLAFALLCFETGHDNRYGIMAGTISYVFCYWAILNAARHPYFLNPMIYFVLLLLGIERIIKNKRSYLFILTVFISSVSNFYFFYIMVLLCVIYVIVRALCLYGKQWKLIGGLIIKIAMPALIGVIMGAIVFVPIVNAFLNDSRMGMGNAYRFLYSLSYYSRLPGGFLSQGQTYWTCMGYTAPAFFAVCLLFIEKKKNRILKIYMGICVLIMVIPFLGQVFNGFSYMSNRWIWVMALLVSYILTAMWPKLMDLRGKEALKLLGCMVAYFVICLFLDYSRTAAVFAAIGIGFVFLFMIFPISFEQKTITIESKQIVALFLVVVSICNVSFWMNASSASNYAAESLTETYIEDNLLLNETAILDEIDPIKNSKDFYRYSGRNITVNAGTLAGISSTQYYWSLANPYISDFRTKMEMAEDIVYNYKGYDDRTALVTLASVKYYIIPAVDKLPIPYGFSYVGTYDIKQEKREEVLEQLRIELGEDTLSDEQINLIDVSVNQSYHVYKNDYELPVAYTYDNYMKQQDWETYNAVAKQEIMQKSVVLDGYEGTIPEVEAEVDSKIIEPEIICNSEHITKDGNKYVVTKANASLTLKFEGLERCETYVGLNGIRFEGTPEYDLYFGEENADPLKLYNKSNWELLSESTQTAIEKNKLFWTAPTTATLVLNSSLGVSKTINYRTEDYSYYNGRHDFTVNMNYSDQKEEWITIQFSNIGTYTIDSLKIVCLPMKGYAADMKALKADPLRKLRIGTDRISGNVNMDSNKIVCFAVPYSVGWSAYIDGNEVPLYRANDRYMAVEVEQGKHKIVLKYETPLLRIGFAGTIAGFIIFIGYVLWNEQKKKRYLSL